MKTNRSLILGSLSLIAAGGCSEKEQSPMNILFIMTDDHTAQMMSCYDTRYAHTPNLDRIAEDGVRFTNSYVANSLSGPSRACMLTGKHSHSNGFYNNSNCIFDNSQQTFPKILRQAGYETAIFGKWHLGSLPTGFDYWEIIPGQGDYYNPDFITADNRQVREEGYLTDIITDKSIEWMKNRRDKEKPFCLLVHHKAQHRNWLADTTHLALYEDRDFELPETFFDTYSGRAAAAAQEMSIVKDMDLLYDLKVYDADSDSGLKSNYEYMMGRMNPEQRKAWNRFYDSVIRDFRAEAPTGEELAKWKFTRYMRDYLKVLKSLDDNVGRLLDYLDESGLAENTLVVYTSDQGFYMGEHGWFDKRFMYEESFSTPLVMRLPGGAKGDIDELVQNIDYAPTFIELAGVGIPEDIQGRSLMPLLRGEKPDKWRKALYYHFYEYPAEHSVKRHYGASDGRWKLIHFYDDINVWELYDLVNDPHEMNNLYGKPGYEKESERMLKVLTELQQEYRDTTALRLNNQ